MITAPRVLPMRLLPGGAELAGVLSVELLLQIIVDILLAVAIVSVLESDRCLEWLVGERCPADPCASSNGVKARVIAGLLAPMLVLGGISMHVPVGSFVGETCFVAAGAWLIAYVWVVPGKIEDLESCNQVEEHHGEAGSA